MLLGQRWWDIYHKGEANTTIERAPGGTAWHGPMTSYLKKVEGLTQALQTSQHLQTELLLAILNSVSAFLQSCIEKLKLSKEEWENLNAVNFWRLKECMRLATKEQADANVQALIKWKNQLGPKLWHDVYVIIPTVWAVNLASPRLEIFRNILDKDRVETHIICSEYPRNVDEARTLLGKIVTDRMIGKYSGSCRVAENLGK